MFIEFIQSLYDQSRPLPENPNDYQTILEDIEYFQLSATVYSLLKQRGRIEQTPEFFQSRLQQDYQYVLYNNLYIKSQLKLIFDIFDANGILTIPLKGTLFAETYFGHFSARRTTDIDLLIQEEDMEKAIACIQSLGYSIENEFTPYHFHRTFSKMMPHSPIPLTIELHWGLLRKNSSGLQIEQFWQHSTTLEGYKNIKKLSEVHTFYMICLHGWNHKLDSLKYFIDIMQIIHILDRKIDYYTLFKIAKTDQTLKRLISTLTIVYHQFPHLDKINKLPINKKSNIWWDYQKIRYMKTGNIKQFKNYIRFYLFDCDTLKHSIISFNRAVFPAREEVINNYQSSKKYNKYKFLEGYLKYYKEKIPYFFKSKR
ncbi:nucleotidyltransferase family protein [Priestia sp. YIM B13448]|uniref:nucleotidyltransferase family protein n=1 Tax=Priestia sp. YIM B13448 TaxID=3366308 RepID=UPI00366CEA7D